LIDEKDNNQGKYDHRLRAERGQTMLGRKALTTFSRAILLGFSVALAVVLDTTTPAEAGPSANYFLKITGINGESNDAHHKDEIEVINFTMAFGGNSACGNLIVSKFIDRASPALVINAIRRARISQAVLTGQTTVDRVADFFWLYLDNFTVQSVSLSDTSGSPPAMEQVALSADVIRVEYREQLVDGSFGPTIKSSVDCRGSKNF